MKQYMNGLRAGAVFFALTRAAILPTQVFAAVTGGDEVITVGDDEVHIFSTVTSSATLTVAGGSATVDLLIVAGGGGGGGKGTNAGGGGGGGGGVVHLTNQVLSAGTYTLSVGAAGTAGATSSYGGNGGDSTFDDGTTVWTAVGGGGGAYGSRGTAGKSGGSGGGSSKISGGASTQNTYDGCGFGHAGGTSGATSSPSGGGGAGSTPTVAKAGGAGLSFDITGTSVMYGAGGPGGGSGTRTSGFGSGGVGGSSAAGTAGTDGIVIVRVKGGVTPPGPVDPEPMTATVTGATGPADGTAYSCTLTVTDPASGYTAKWYNTSTSAFDLDLAPAYTAEGVYTNFVKVTADNYLDFYGTGVVTVTHYDPPPGPGVPVGGNAYATVENGVCTITGTGAITDTSAIKALGVTNLVIGSGITSLGNKSFASFQSIHNLTIASTVTNIGQQAFAKCANITNVVIATGGEQVYVGKWAFTRCNTLLRITITGSSTVVWGEDAFSLQTGIRMVGGLPEVFPIPEIVYQGENRTVLYGSTDLNTWTKITTTEQRALYNFFKIAIE